MLQPLLALLSLSYSTGGYLFQQTHFNLLFYRRAPEVRFREGYGMTELAPAVTFVRGTHLVTGGSTGQLLPNTSMKVKSAKRLHEQPLTGAGSGHWRRAWGRRDRRTLFQWASGFERGLFQSHTLSHNNAVLIR